MIKKGKKNLLKPQETRIYLRVDLQFKIFFVLVKVKQKLISNISLM